MNTTSTTTTDTTTSEAAPAEAIHAPSVAIVMKETNAHGQVWIQVAKPGAFRGHAAGAFEMTAATFREVIRNAAGRPVPIDFEHASEAPSNQGSIPVLGAPAQGWITKLELRADGNLWGLATWGDLAKKYIKAGQYKFLSPAIVFGCKDRVTGAPIGARLSSVALTNNPFLSDMAPVTATALPKTLTPAAAGAPTSTPAPLAPDGATHPETVYPTSTPAPLDRLQADDDGDATDMSAKPCAACAEAAAKVEALTTENEELRARLVAHDDRELATMVASARSWGSTATEATLMSLARGSREAFAEMFPPIPAGQAHLALNLVSGSARRDAAADVEGQSIAMRDAAAAPLPEIGAVVAQVEAEAKAKGLTISREVAFIEAHERLVTMAVTRRRDAGAG